METISTITGESLDIRHRVSALIESVGIQFQEGLLPIESIPSLVAEALVTEAGLHGYVAAASSALAPTATEQPWLWDLAWIQRDSQYVSRVALAVEFSWLTAPGEVLRQFEKLLVTRADCKLLLFCCDNDLVVDGWLQGMKAAIDSFWDGAPGHQYFLLAGMDRSRGLFLFRWLGRDRQAGALAVQDKEDTH